jgi:hypothetical protein
MKAQSVDLAPGIDERDAGDQRMIHVITLANTGVV